MSRISLRDLGCPVRLLMKNCRFLPEGPFGRDCHNLARRIFEYLGHDVEGIGPDHVPSGRHPRSKRADFEADFGTDISFPQKPQDTGY